MVSPALFSPRNGDRPNYRTIHSPYLYLAERRSYPGSLPQHNSRALTMADQSESDSSSQRKRISVACGRCRKRKIRCSGDPGGGQPCINCKQAGTEPCLFVRMRSQEVALRNDSIDFPYNVQDARSHGSSLRGLPYTTHELPHAGSAEMLASSPYRGGTTYSYSKPTSYFSSMPNAAGYSMGYVEEYADYPTMTHHSSPHVLSHEMVPYSTWTSRDYGYGGTTNLVHRPAPSMASESAANFSFHNLAAHLPASSASVSDRLLPAPSSRSMSYPSSQSQHPPSYRTLSSTEGTVTDPSPVNAAAVLADMASGTYAHSFDASGLPYTSSSAGVPLNSQAGSDHHSSRTNSESYSPDTESIFTEHEQGLRSQGSAVDLNAYTYSGTESGSNSLRRGSAASGCPTSVSSSNHSSSINGSGSGSGSNSAGSGGTRSGNKGNSSSTSTASTTTTSSSQGSIGSMTHGHHSQQHTYMPTSSIQDSTSSIHPHDHHLPLVTATGGGSAVPGGTGPATAYLADSNASSGPSGTGRAESRRATVGNRR